MRTEYVVARPVDNRYLVRERDRQRFRQLAEVFAAVILAGAGLLAYTTVHVQILSTGYRVQALEVELAGLEQLERQLELERSYLASPGRVERRARAELGMELPRLEQMVFPTEGP